MATPSAVPPTTEQVTEALSRVNDPEIHRPITELGMVKEVEVSPDGAVVAAGGHDGSVRIYNGATGALVKAAVPPGADKPKDAPKDKAMTKGKGKK